MIPATNTSMLGPNTGYKDSAILPSLFCHSLVPTLLVAASAITNACTTSLSNLCNRMSPPSNFWRKHSVSQEIETSDSNQLNQELEISVMLEKVEGVWSEVMNTHICVCKNVPCPNVHRLNLKSHIEPKPSLLTCVNAIENLWFAIFHSPVFLGARGDDWENSSLFAIRVKKSNDILIKKLYVGMKLLEISKKRGEFRKYLAVSEIARFFIVNHIMKHGYNIRAETKFGEHAALSHPVRPAPDTFRGCKEVFGQSMKNLILTGVPELFLGLRMINDELEQVLINSASIRTDTNDVIRWMIQLIKETQPNTVQAKLCTANCKEDLFF